MTTAELAFSPHVPDDPDDDARELPELGAARALPTPTAAAVAARLLVVFAILGWYGLRRFWGALTETLDGPQALRMAFERLGPIYVKLGQLIASGEALFPARYSEEFRKLLDRVPPIAWTDVQRVVREDLGRPIEEAFAEVDPKPLAAASIAQVHTAKLHDGTDVVIKVQRPGIAERAAADVAILRGFARLAEWASDLARGSSVVAFVDDFQTNLERELDFRLEAQRMRDFMAVMRAMGNRLTAAPIVHDELTRARVLTMERFRGWRIDDVEAVRASGFDVEDRLLQGIRAWFQPLILRGFFHGDVHAGNFMLLEDGRIGFLDFGIVGDLGAMDRKGVIEFVVGFQQRDFVRVATAMLSMGAAQETRDVDPDLLGADMARAFAPAIGEDGGFDLKDLVPGLIGSARKHGLRMPRDLVLVTKQLVYLDRVTRTYGGARMNVLTDERLTNLITQDVLAAMFAR
jgi:predicted unusual protein kinase regulating ubiquinone biosynthesis (AarF/ABC1/UbiB family)